MQKRKRKELDFENTHKGRYLDQANCIGLEKVNFLRDRIKTSYWLQTKEKDKNCKTNWIAWYLLIIVRHSSFEVITVQILTHFLFSIFTVFCLKGVKSGVYLNIKLASIKLHIFVKSNQGSKSRSQIFHIKLFIFQHQAKMNFGNSEVLDTKVVLG